MTTTECTPIGIATETTSDPNTTTGTPSTQPSPATAAVKFTPDDFSFGRLLGEGAYARVMLATRKSDLQQFAIKVVDKLFITKHNRVSEIQTEKRILTECRHPNMIQLHATFQDKHSLYYVLELAEGGEMFDQLKRFGSYDIHLARFYAAELVCVLEYLHGKGIVHRDLKPENILFSSQRHIKLADFGTAKFTHDLDSKLPSQPDSGAESGSRSGSKARGNSFVGTAEYVAPELLNSQRTGPQVDMWALGCVIYQMLAGRPPFRGASEYLTFQQIIKRELSYPPELDPFARDLIDHLLVIDPQERLGATPRGYQQLKTHPFFEGIDFDSLDVMRPPPLPQVTAPRPPVSAVQDHHGDGSDSDPDSDAEEKDKSTSSRASASATSHHILSKQEAGPGSGTVSVWQQFLMDDERIVYAGLVTKGRGLWAVRRQLILTSLPRMVYCDPVKMVLKKEIQWSATLRAELKNSRTFLIHTPKRVYHMVGLSSAAACWVQEINQLQDYYLTKHAEE